MVRPYGGEYVLIRSHSTRYHTLNKLLHIQFVAILDQARFFFLPYWLPQLAYRIPVRMDHVRRELLAMEREDLPGLCQVHVSEERSCLLKLDQSTTLDQLRQMINEAEEIPIEHIALFRGKQELTDRIVYDLNMIGHWPCHHIQVKLSVNVTPMSGDTIRVLVFICDDVLDIMNEIQDHTGWWPDQQCLLWGSTMLVRRAPLTVYGVHKDPNLNLAVKQLGPFRIFDQDGELFTMCVEPRDTIKEVKRKLSEAEGTPEEYITLYHDGAELSDDERTLTSCNIEVTSTVEASILRY